MDVNKEPAIGIVVEQEPMDFGDIFRSIFTSCDVENTDLVRVSHLIDYIKPFLMEDLNALEDLRLSLDPEGTNAFVNSEKFYEVMGPWCQKVAAASSGEDTDFDRSSRSLTVIDDKDLPYTHSTPRASLGDKLLKCKDLLNLSNVSAYSLSTSRLDHPVESDKSVLEEEIKNLQYQLLKTSNELMMTKQQLSASEDHNDQLQQDLERINRRLHSEQQVNEHLQKDIKYSEDLRDELDKCKKNIEELKKKLSQSEKDSLYRSELMNEKEQEKINLEKKMETLSKQHQDCLKEMFDIKTELDTKDEQVTEMSNVYNELKRKLSQQKDLIDQMREENDLLRHQKSTLENALKVKPSNSTHSNLGNLLLDISKTPSPPSQYNTSSSFLSSPQYQDGVQPKCQSMPLLRRVLSRHSSTPVSPLVKEGSLLEGSPPDVIKSVPVLSPIRQHNFDGGYQGQGSSEEDIYWKLQHGQEMEENAQELNGTSESLHAEMHRADPLRLYEATSYPTFIFEKEERIAELEDEIDKLKVYIEDIEGRSNESIAKLKEQKTANDELMENNFIMATREQAALSKIETLKQRIGQLEQNGIIVEQECEFSQGEIDDMRDQLRILQATLTDKEVALQLESEKVEALEKDLVELRGKLRNEESLRANYDEKLQSTVRDLGAMSAEKLSLQEKIQSLQTDKLQAEQKLTDATEPFESLLTERNALQEKLAQFEQISRRNEQLEEELFIAKQDLECSRSKCENLMSSIAFMEEEIRSLKELDTNRREEVADHQEYKAKLEKELAEFKDKLEKKLVSEFEGKVKYSMDAEEKILYLTQKCNKLEEELESLHGELSSKARALADAEDQIALLTNKNELLQKEIDSLNSSKTELEVELAQLKVEQDNALAKLNSIDNIDVVAAEIQKHIISKNSVIDELKRLNRKLEINVCTTQFDLKRKIENILELRNELAQGLGIRNELWKNAKALQKDLYKKISENNQLVQNYQAIIDLNEDLRIEYSNLLIVYDLEVNKNGKLVNQVAKCTEEKDGYSNKCSELEIELENARSKITTENDKNQCLTKLISEYEDKIRDLELNNKELNETSAASHSITSSFTDIEHVFSEIKTEGDQLLEELETRLNEEVNKNLSLTNDFVQMKENYTKNNAELDEMKRKLADNEAEMAKKLQKNCEKYKRLAMELTQTKEHINRKDIEISRIEKEMEETKSDLKKTDDELKEIRQKLADSETEMARRLQENSYLAKELNGAKESVNEKGIEVNKIENELKYTKEILENKNRELSEAKELISANDVNISQLSNELKQIESVLIVLKNRIKDMEDTEQKLKTDREKSEKHNKELEEELKKLNIKLNEKQIEIDAIKEKNKLIEDERDQIQQENNRVSNVLKRELDDARDEKEKLSKEVVELRECISIQKTENMALTERIKCIEGDFTQKIDLTKREKDLLNEELVILKQNLSATEKEKNSLFNKTNQRLQEEITKNKALFENFKLLQQQRDQLIFDLKEAQALNESCQASCYKKQSELQNLQKKYSLFEAQIDSLKMQLEESQNNVKIVTVQRDLFNCQVTKLQTLLSEKESCERDVDRDPNKGKTYSRQQITIEKLKEKVEDLEGQLKMEKNKNQESSKRLSLMEEKIAENKKQCNEELARLQEQVRVKQFSSEALHVQNEKLNGQIIILEEKLKMERSEVRNQVSRENIVSKSTGEVGIQVDGSDDSKDRCQGKPINKFTLASGSESPDSPSLDIEAIGLASSRNSLHYTKSAYSINSDSILEVPSLDVSGFADDIIEELELDDSSPRKKLDLEELEKKVTALTLRLVANSNSVSERIEKQTEKYRCQYEEILTLVRDISNRLRDHVCIGTAEPIVPVYVLLEEIKLQLKGLVQNASQVGVLICEDRMKRCWNLVINYLALLRQDNESLHNVSRETTPTQTGAVRRRNRCTQDKSDLTEPARQRRSRFGRCTKTIALTMFIVALAMTVSLLININCRMTASENQYCPFDAIAQRINIGLPPM